MGARVVEALRDIAAAHPDGRVLVVTHGGPMRSIWLAAAATLDAWQRLGQLRRGRDRRRGRRRSGG